jgi:hypothetical protein
MQRWKVLWVALAFLGACHHVPSVQRGGRPVSDYFRFRVGFWINLHHSLYAASAADAEAPIAAQLPAEERREWDAAIRYYRDHFADRSLLFDATMRDIDEDLSAAESQPRVGGPHLLPELAARLERVAPIFHARVWTGRERACRAWISGIMPQLDRFGAAVAERLARIYGTPWPLEPMLVDVVGEAGATGAYSTVDPPHLVIAAEETRNQGERGLEVLFHEASHELVDETRTQLEQRFRARGKEAPPDLWHVLLFFTAGEVLRSLRGDYQTYAELFGLYRGDWERYRRVMAACWRPFLDGKVGREDALEAIAGAL